MKKVFMTAFAVMAFVAMTACGNNNTAAEATEETPVESSATEQCDKHCEGDTATCCQKKECDKQCDKAEGQECCQKAE